MQKADFKNHLDDLPKPEISNKQPKEKLDPEFDVESIWKIVLENVRLYVSERNFNAWFSNVYLEKIDNGMAEISCDQVYKREWIETNHRGLLKKCLLQATGQNLEILIAIRSTIRKNETEAEKTEKYEYYDPKEGKVDMFSSAENEEVQTKSAISTAKLNPKYLFGNFIVGPNNQLANAVAEAVIDNLGKAYNPVFFYGNTGLGKTHLMQAIGNEILNRDHTKKVIYISIEQFLNELIEAIRTKGNEAFRQKYREIDLLIIDDIQFVENYPKTQEELFHTFNTLYQANKQIILASDRSPKEIKNITDRLRSRFEGGMVADLQAPDYETRMAILKQILSNSDLKIPDTTLTLIAQNIENNVRELEGAITKILSMSRLGETPSEEKVAQMLQIDIESKRKRIKPARVIDVVSDVFDVSKQEIKGKRRTAYIALSRQVVMYLLRKELDLPLEKIAREVNRRDHTTVLHACDKITLLLEENARVGEKVEKCHQILNKGV